MVKMYKISIRQMGDNAILIEWPQRIEDAILEDIIRMHASLKNATWLPKMIDFTPAYASLLIQYAEPIVDVSEEKDRLLRLYNETGKKLKKSCYYNWYIPVCYDPSLGIDIGSYGDLGLSSDDVKKIHTSATYRVYMIGFLPGFLYLGGLPEVLHRDRMQSPRMRTPAGSIAIGGSQTGIYPMESPGGWHVIGRTPLSLFDISADVPTPIKQGDYVKFYAVNMEVYKGLM